MSSCRIGRVSSAHGAAEGRGRGRGRGVATPRSAGGSPALHAGFLHAPVPSCHGQLLDLLEGCTILFKQYESVCN